MTTSPISILVVEDDPDVGILLEHVLASAGDCVDRASTALESREALINIEEAVRCLIEMNGEAALRLKEIEAAENSPEG